MYKIFSHGNTVSRKTYSTTIESLLRQQNLTYLFLIRKIYFPKTQDFLQPQEKCSVVIRCCGFAACMQHTYPQSLILWASTVSQTLILVLKEIRTTNTTQGFMPWVFLLFKPQFLRFPLGLFGPRDTR